MSKPKAFGVLSCAVGPSRAAREDAAFTPTSVVTRPAGVMARTMCEAGSATSSVLSVVEVSTTARGSVKPARVPRPSA